MGKRTRANGSANGTQVAAGDRDRVLAELSRRAGEQIAWAAAALRSGEGPTAPEVDEYGISGTVNYSGQILAETNAKLTHDRAHGSAGWAEWGVWERLVRTDPDCAASLEPVKAQIRDARLDVVPAEDAGAAGKQQADFLRWNLAEALEPTWPELMEQMVGGALTSGFVIHETVAAETEHPLLPSGRGYRCRKLAERLPSSIDVNGWIEDDQGRDLVSVRQSGPRGGKGGWATINIPAERLLLLSWGRSGNNYAGYSIFRPVYYPAQIREHLLRIIGIGHSRESLGIPTASTADAKNTLTPTQRRSLSRLLANLTYHEAAHAVMPAGWKLDWIYSPGANKGHVIETWERLGLVIMRILQAQQMYLGTSSTGSRAVGEVHDGNADSFAQGVIAKVEAVLNGVGDRRYTGLARRIIEWNWGPQKSYPRITLTLKKAKLRPVERLAGLKEAVAAGAFTVTAKDENVIREELGFESIDEAERAQLQAEKAAAAAAVLERQRQAFGGGEGGPGTAERDDAAGGKPRRILDASSHPLRGAEQPGAPRSFVPRRPLRSDEEHVHYAAIGTFLEDGRADFERRCRPILFEMLASAIPDIRSAMADGDPSDVAERMRLDTTRLSAAIGSFLNDVTSEGYRQASAEQRRRVDVSKKREDGDPTPTTSSKFYSRRHRAAEEEEEKEDEQGPAEPTPELEDFEERTDRLQTAMRKQLLRRIEQRLRADTEAAAIEVLRKGGDPDDVVEGVMATQLERATLRTDAGLVLTKAFNMGREEFAAERGDTVVAVRLSALLDGAQCRGCEAMDGTEFEPFSDEHESHVPPLTDVCDGGENCRCLLTYEFERGE